MKKKKKKEKKEVKKVTCQKNKPPGPRRVADKGARAEEARPLTADVVAVDELAHGGRRRGARGVGHVVGADRGAGDGAVAVVVGDREAPRRRGERGAQADRLEELCARHLVEGGLFFRRSGGHGVELLRRSEDPSHKLR